MVAADQALTLWEDLLGRGARPCGLGARDTLRLEAAMPLYGHELNEETDPFQAGLGWAVKLDKGDFVGRDALLRRKNDPALRRRVGLEVEGKRIAREGAAVLAERQGSGPRDQRHLLPDPGASHRDGLRRSGPHRDRHGVRSGHPRQAGPGPSGAAAVLQEGEVSG